MVLNEDRKQVKIQKVARDMTEDCVYPFRKINDHYFIEVEGGLWLVDTGAPITFGTTKALNICGEHFHFNNTYLSLSTQSLSEFIGTACNGLLGMDILRVHDILFDSARGEAVFGDLKVMDETSAVPLEDFMGIPVLPVGVNDRTYRMFFDTGAQLSYFQDASIHEHTEAGEMEDFFPDNGRFSTQTYYVEMMIGSYPMILRSGMLPGLLGMTLQLANVQGIIGNQIFNYAKSIHFSSREKVLRITI